MDTSDPSAKANLALLLLPLLLLLLQLLEDQPQVFDAKHQADALVVLPVGTHDDLPEPLIDSPLVLGLGFHFFAKIKRV